MLDRDAADARSCDRQARPRRLNDDDHGRGTSVLTRWPGRWTPEQAEAMAPGAGIRSEPQGSKSPKHWASVPQAVKLSRCNGAGYWCLDIKALVWAFERATRRATRWLKPSPPFSSPMSLPISCSRPTGWWRNKRKPLALGAAWLHRLRHSRWSRPGQSHPALLALAAGAHRHRRWQTGPVCRLERRRALRPSWSIRPAHRQPHGAAALLPDLWAHGLWAPGLVATTAASLGPASGPTVACPSAIFRRSWSCDRPDPRHPRRRLCRRPADGALRRPPRPRRRREGLPGGGG